MQLFVFNRDLELLGMVDLFTSLQWEKKYIEVGEFELNCDWSEDNQALLIRENIIYKQGDPQAGYIETQQNKKTVEGKETITIKGKLLSGYLNRRIIWGTEIIKSTVETAMRRLVNNNCIAPTDPTRAINNMVLDNFKDITTTVDYSVSYTNLLEEITSLATTHNIGFRTNLDIDNRLIKFEVYKGVDRSVNQSVNPHCIFSSQFDNLMDQDFISSLNNYKNVVLVGGIGEAENRKLKTVGTATGLDRFEIFSDQKSLSNEVQTTTYDNVTTETIAASELARVNAVKADIATNTAAQTTMKNNIEAAKADEVDRIEAYRAEILSINNSTTLSHGAKSLALIAAEEQFKIDMDALFVIEANFESQLTALEAAAANLVNQSEIRTGFVTTETHQVATTTTSLMNDAEYNALMNTKGTETLAEHAEILSSNCTINLNSNQKYGVDFLEGDIVTVVNHKWGITMDVRIMSVKEVWEEDGMTLTATFGETVPTLSQKIKQMIKGKG